ncbi:hypothetical protein M378DRAFT_47054, partial [Amanita muscaria Koide BX008]
DIDHLSTIWDDMWPSWAGNSPLVIKNEPIPLKHFRTVYIHTQRWKMLKQQWSKWNFLMAEYQSLGPSNFWAKWSKNGIPEKPSQILDSLKAERRARDQRDATAAKEEYVTDFGGTFAYRKGGKTFTMKTERVIAGKFRKLK